MVLTPPLTLVFLLFVPLQHPLLHLQIQPILLIKAAKDPILHRPHFPTALKITALLPDHHHKIQTRKEGAWGVTCAWVQPDTGVVFGARGGEAAVLEGGDCGQIQGDR